MAYWCERSDCVDSGSPCEPDAFEVKISGNNGLTGSVVARRLTNRLPIW